MLLLIFMGKNFSVTLWIPTLDLIQKKSPFLMSASAEPALILQVEP